MAFEIIDFFFVISKVVILAQKYVYRMTIHREEYSLPTLLFFDSRLRTTKTAKRNENHSHLAN